MVKLRSGRTIDPSNKSLDERLISQLSKTADPAKLLELPPKQLEERCREAVKDTGPSVTVDDSRGRLIRPKCFFQAEFISFLSKIPISCHELVETLMWEEAKQVNFFYDLGHGYKKSDLPVLEVLDKVEDITFGIDVSVLSNPSLLKTRNLSELIDEFETYVNSRLGALLRDDERLTTLELDFAGVGNGFSSIQGSGFFDRLCEVLLKHISHFKLVIAPHGGMHAKEFTGEEDEEESDEDVDSVNSDEFTEWEDLTELSNYTNDIQRDLNRVLTRPSEIWYNNPHHILLMWNPGRGEKAGSDPDEEDFWAHE